MLTQGEDVEVHALQQRGWSISAIARHLERDRKTVRAYVRGERRPGSGAGSGPDPLEPFVGLPARPASAMTRICGRRRCTTRSSPWATRAATRASRGSSGRHGLRPALRTLRGASADA